MNCKSCGDKIECETEGEELCPTCWAYGEQYAHEQHEFITEEIWEILKKYKNPTINFQALHRFVIQRIKELSGVF